MRSTLKRLNEISLTSSSWFLGGRNSHAPPHQMNTSAAETCAQVNWENLHTVLLLADVSSDRSSFSNDAAMRQPSHQNKKRKRVIKTEYSKLTNTAHQGTKKTSRTQAAKLTVESKMEAIHPKLHPWASSLSPHQAW